MSYVLEGTIWPDRPIPVATKQLLANLLEIGDIGSPESGANLAELFTGDGVLDHGSYKFEGKEEISNARRKPKPGSQIIKRRHRISRVYSQTEKADDLMIIAELVVEYENGNVVHNVVASRAVVEDHGHAGEPRFKLWAVYLDPTNMMNAAQE